MNDEKTTINEDEFDDYPCLSDIIKEQKENALLYKDQEEARKIESERLHKQVVHPYLEDVE